MAGPTASIECPGCGYDLSGLPEDGRACPECRSAFDIDRLRLEASVLLYRARWVLLLTLPIGWWTWYPTTFTSPPAWFQSPAGGYAWTDCVQLMVALLLSVSMVTVAKPSLTRSRRAFLHASFAVIGFYVCVALWETLSRSSIRQFPPSWNVRYRSLVAWSGLAACAGGLVSIALTSSALAAQATPRVTRRLLVISAWLCVPAAATLALAHLQRAAVKPMTSPVALWDLKTLGEWWSNSTTSALLKAITDMIGIGAWAALWLGLLSVCARSVSPVSTHLLRRP
ncbi:MAG: hypothetical protein AABZ53_09515 [Planctomycetota bacterium]